MSDANHISASFARTHELSLILLDALHREETPVGYGLLACALTFGRLLNPTTRLSDDEEIAFVQDLMAYGGAYWGDHAEVMS